MCAPLLSFADRYMGVVVHGIRFTGTFETTYPGYQRFAYSMEHTRTARGIKRTVGIETPFRGYEKFGGNVEHTQGERNGFRVGSQITTSIQVKN